MITVQYTEQEAQALLDLLFLAGKAAPNPAAMEAAVAMRKKIEDACKNSLNGNSREIRNDNPDHITHQ